SKTWYGDNELVHKIGVFLYGKPGTGKSTVAKAISSMFNNAPILTIDPNNIMSSVNGILKMRKKYEGTIIVLIEDFDMYFKSREELDGCQLDNEQKKKKDNNQNAIFQLLDGIYSTDNTIYIATTNYKDRIDSALIRHGRFDIQEELDYFDEDQALDCVKLLGYDKKVLDKLKIEYPTQPSYLQSKIMEYRASLLIV
ncbi:AAA family ATPase, partial [Anaerosporobacter sp.]